MNNNDRGNDLEIVVIGMAGRFPQAKDIDHFWENLKNGVETITYYSEKELLEVGIDPDLLKNPNYVKCGGGLLEDKEYFDSFFFGYSPIEAELMDPQVRIFHECAWHAMENAGYDPFSYNGLIGLYAGASFNLTWEAQSMLSGRADILGGFSSAILIDPDYLCTRVSYNLNLKGPSVVVKTACSTSLVAVHMACQAILNGECDMALAGGVNITLIRKNGYMYQEDMIFSPDGHCRAFDAQAQGTIYGEGLGIVVLKSLEDAVRDRDNINAVIKGSAINNDGIRKIGYTAPSVEGQYEVISDALQIADVDPETVTYVETHGTGTPVGDPIEIKALKMGFNNDKKKFCRIGSVKTNIGHLDAAAGIAGFIKTVLCLKHQLIPPSLHFKSPNPQIDLENSPFYVNNKLTGWKRNGHPLRAAVSSFGIGGTNAHVVLEEAPETNDSSESRNWKLLLLSGKTQSALERKAENLWEFLKDKPDVNLADAAYTLQLGRTTFPYRRALVCSDVDDAMEKLSAAKKKGSRTFHSKEEKRTIIFMFSGLGSQYVNMGQGLYQTEPEFRAEMDRCFNILDSIIDYDIKEILYPSLQSAPDLNHIEIAQVIIFVLEYALAKVLMKWGLEPDAMIGYSFGEYTAACLSGVFSLENALKLIVTRGKLIAGTPLGTMLSVPLSMEEVEPLLTDELSIAIDNGPSCVISGPGNAVDALQRQLKEKRHLCMPLATSHAIHSKMMNSISTEFEEYLRTIKLNKPQIPYISNLTGQWITVKDAVNPTYWAKHLKEVVRFADGIETLLKEPNVIFIEIGPGRDLSTLLVRHKKEENGTRLRSVNIVKSPQQEFPDDYYLLNGLGQLWLHGVNIDWQSFYAGEERCRIPLPTYPFVRQRYWFDTDPIKEIEQILLENSLSMKRKDITDWFYTSQWIRSTLLADANSIHEQTSWLLFINESTLGNQLAQQLKNNNHHVVVVKPGINFEQLRSDEYAINPGNPDDFDTLFNDLVQAGKIPRNVVHLWCLTGNSQHKTTMKEIDRLKDLGLYSLLNIAGAIGNHAISDDIQLGVIVDNMQYVTGEEELCPAKAITLAPIKIIPLEYSNISCRSIDIINPGDNTKKIKFIIDSLLKEFSAGFAEHQVIAYRGTCRWKEQTEPVKLNNDTQTERRLKEKGVYLVTGALGGMGFSIAEYLAQTLKAKLILVDKLDFPVRERQDQWLSSEDRKKDIHVKEKKIEDWKALGAEIQIHNADVSDYQQMKEVISKSEKGFGKIDGVIHTAGLADYAGIIQRRTREMTEEVLAPKINGTLILDELLKEHQLDFMVLFSSIGNIFYNLRFGQIGSNASHEFLDAFSYSKQKEERFTVTINWNNWTEVGMAVRAANAKKNHSTKNEALSAYEDIFSCSPSEGITVFNRILNNNLCRVIVSPRDLKNMIEYINDSKSEELGSTHDLLKTDNNYEKLYERPELSNPYVSPSDKTEQSMVEIWTKLFGIKKIGIEDDFFELGGDSLMATKMITQIHQEIQMRIPLTEVFNMPTIKKLAEYIRRKEKRGFGLVDETIVLIKEGSNNSPHFFFIHDVTGEIEFYVELCNSLNINFNFWGIKADKIETLSPRNFRLEEMSAGHVQKIQSVQPKGPYFIAGYCAGGMLAFEIALQLKKMNEEIKFVGVFDTPAPQGDANNNRFSIENELNLVSEYIPKDEIMKRTVNVSDLNQFWSIIVDYLEEINFDAERVREIFPPNIARLIPNFDQKSVRELIYYWNMNRSYLNAEECYFPGMKNNITIFSFEAINSYLWDIDFKLHWSDFSSNHVETYKIQGDHVNFIKKPHVEEFAKIFDDVLLKALNS